MAVNLRMERIERLLEELKYEVTRGMMEREIEETMGFEFLVPISNEFPKGIVYCQFHTRPMPHPPFTSPEHRGLYVVKKE